MIEFLIAAKLFLADWFLFPMLLINFLRKALQNLENYILTYKKKNRKEYLAQQLDVPKNSCSKNSRETSLF